MVLTTTPTLCGTASLIPATYTPDSRDPQTLNVCACVYKSVSLQNTSADSHNGTTVELPIITDRAEGGEKKNRDERKRRKGGLAKDARKARKTELFWLWGVF